MFDIGFPELVLIAVVGLLVIGPERLPEALRTLGLWLGRMRRSFTNVKNEIEKEIGMDEVRRQLHNESVMEEMKRIESQVRDTANDTKDLFNSIQGEPSHPFDPRDADQSISDTANDAPEGAEQNSETSEDPSGAEQQVDAFETETQPPAAVSSPASNQPDTADAPPVSNQPDTADAPPASNEPEPAPPNKASG